MPPTRIIPIPAVRPSFAPMRKLNFAIISPSGCCGGIWERKAKLRMNVSARTTTRILFRDGDGAHRWPNSKAAANRGLLLSMRGEFGDQREVTTTAVPTDTRWYRSLMSSLYIRMQPYETNPPTDP